MSGFAEGLTDLFTDGECVREHLGGMPLIGQTVKNGNAGVASESFDIFLLIAAELNAIEHAAEHARGIGDRFLVSHL